MNNRLWSSALAAAIVLGSVLTGVPQLSAAPRASTRTRSRLGQRGAGAIQLPHRRLAGRRPAAARFGRGKLARSGRTGSGTSANPTPAIRYVVTDGKLIKTARFTYDEPTGLFHAAVTLPDGTTRDYEGKFDDDRLVLESKPDAKREIHRITVTRLNEKRTVVLFEKKRAAARSPSASRRSATPAKERAWPSKGPTAPNASSPAARERSKSPTRARRTTSAAPAASRPSTRTPKKSSPNTANASPNATPTPNDVADRSRLSSPVTRCPRPEKNRSMLRRTFCKTLIAVSALSIAGFLPAADRSRSARWERAIEAFEAADKKSPPAPAPCFLSVRRASASGRRCRPTFRSITC